MTPEQFEHHVAAIYAQKGYITQVTPHSNDWGIDVIAEKGEEKLAIQAKMFGGSSRSVNRRAIMEIYGAAAYQDCTLAVMATDGNVLPDALLVAAKLGVKVMKVYRDELIEMSCDENNTAENDAETPEQEPSGRYPSFSELWEKYIKPLAGTTLRVGTLINTVVNVSNSGIRRRTSKGNDSNINIECFRFTYSVLLSQGYVSRDYINNKYDKERCSSGIVRILGQVPFIEITSHPKGLRLK